MFCIIIHQQQKTAGILTITNILTENNMFQNENSMTKSASPSLQCNSKQNLIDHHYVIDVKKKRWGTKNTKIILRTKW